MSFSEWLTLRNQEPNPPRLAGGFADLKALFAPPLQTQALAALEKATAELPHYLLWGGLPEQLELELPLVMWHRNLEEAVLGMALLRDVISRFSVRDPARLELLVRLLAEKSGWPLSTTGLAKTLQLKADTVRSYLTFLEHARLLLPCPLFTRNLPKQIRRNAKYYLMDPGLLCALRGARQLDNQNYGPTLEQAVALHLHNLELNSGHPLATGLRYWSYKHEVDFILQLRGVGPASLLPVAFKAKGAISDKDLKGIAEFMALQGCPAGVVVTRDIFDIL